MTPFPTAWPALLPLKRRTWQVWLDGCAAAVPDACNLLGLAHGAWHKAKAVRGPATGVPVCFPSSRPAGSERDRCLPLDGTEQPFSTPRKRPTTGHGAWGHVAMPQEGDAGDASVAMEYRGLYADCSENTRALRAQGCPTAMTDDKLRMDSWLKHWPPMWAQAAVCGPLPANVGLRGRLLPENLVPF
jgi:hypothetical protein